MKNITFRLAVLAMFLALTINVNAQRQDSITNGRNQTAMTNAITINLFYTGKNGSARKFVEEMESSGTADSIRNEPGNLGYDYFVSLSDPETVLLIDRTDSLPRTTNSSGISRIPICAAIGYSGNVFCDSDSSSRSGVYMPLSQIGC